MRWAATSFVAARTRPTSRNGVRGLGFRVLDSGFWVLRSFIVSLGV
jgi:hypothetical protein